MINTKINKKYIFKHYEDNRLNFMHKAKLILLEVNTDKIEKGSLVYNEALESYDIQSYDIDKGDPVLNTTIKLIHPYVVSITDEAKTGELGFFYSIDDHGNLSLNVQIVKDHKVEKHSDKVLATPNQISKEDIKFICDGLLKEGLIYVQCYISNLEVEGEINSKFEYGILFNINKYIEIFDEQKVIWSEIEYLFDEFWNKFSLENYENIDNVSLFEKESIKIDWLKRRYKIIERF